MPVKPSLYAVLVTGTFFFVSCGGNKTDEEKVKTDSTQTTMDPALEKVLPHFAEATFPYQTDTTVLAHIPEKDSLVSAEVRLLSTSWMQHQLTDGVGGELSDFYTIDSVRCKGLYSKWADTLDIGMTKFSNVYPLHKLKLNDKTWILTWALRSASYEACPYFSFTNVYATLVYEGKVAQSFILGEVMGAGDPPSAMNRRLTSELTADGKITLKEFEESDDMDAEFSTQVNNEYWFEIKDGKYVSVKENKGKEVEVKHPAEENLTEE